MRLNQQTDSRIRLLLVDDEAGFTAVLKKRLIHRGFEAESVGSGTEAIRLLRMKDFDIAILDLKMEDMDGIELIRILTKMQPSLQVIMLTGHGSETSVREGLQLGAFDFLIKPCEFEDLLAKIQEAFLKKKEDRNNARMEMIRVLLVDDEERFVVSNSKLLKKMGFEIWTALNGAEALRQLEENDIHVAVVDVKMPGMNGITLLGEIKKRFPLVEVVMLTGNATFESAVTGLKIGASDYLMKPVDLNELIEKIKEAHEKRKLQEEKTLHGKY